tara:strand:- start:2360 stop:2536 length:177 start_codon:yes stop_codon:yes gene_type:complete
MGLMHTGVSTALKTGTTIKQSTTAMYSNRTEKLLLAAVCCIAGILGCLVALAIIVLLF